MASDGGERSDSPIQGSGPFVVERLVWQRESRQGAHTSRSSMNRHPGQWASPSKEQIGTPFAVVTDQGDSDDTLLFGLELSTVDVHRLRVSENQVMRNATTWHVRHQLSLKTQYTTSAHQAHG